MSTQVPIFGFFLASQDSRFACNCRRTFATTAPAALPTASMLNAVKTNGRSPPMKKQSDDHFWFGERELVRKNSTATSDVRANSCTYDPNKTSAANPADAMP